MYPSFDYKGPYNVDPREVRAEVFANSDILPPLVDEEFQEVYDALCRVMARHGRIMDRNRDFYVYDDKYFDRTQKVEVNSDRIVSCIDALIGDLQLLLRRYELWRIALIGQRDEDAIIIYPTAIRLACDVDASTETLRTAARRLSGGD